MVPGHMMWAAYQMIAFTRAWSAMEADERIVQGCEYRVVRVA